MGNFKNLTPEQIKRVCLQYVKENGYISGAYGYHNNNGTTYRGSPTVEEVYRIMNNSEDLTPYLADDKLYDDMNKYVSGFNPSSKGQYADFFKKCKDAWALNTIAKTDLSMICSFCKSFFREQEYLDRQEEIKQKKMEHEREVKSNSNIWAGQVNDVITFKVKSVDVDHYTGASWGYSYGASYPVYKIVDENGLTYMWSDIKAGDCPIKPGDTITAKIKDLKEFRGIKQTKIWRLKINDVQIPDDVKPAAVPQQKQDDQDDDDEVSFFLKKFVK